MTPHLPNPHLQSSNSTANIFLGGVRRSWMDILPSDSSTATTTTAATTTTSSAIPSTVSPPVSTVTVTPAPPAGGPGMRDSARVPPALSAPENVVFPPRRQSNLTLSEIVGPSPQPRSPSRPSQPPLASGRGPASPVIVTDATAPTATTTITTTTATTASALPPALTPQSPSLSVFNQQNSSVNLKTTSQEATGVPTPPPTRTNGGVGNVPKVSSGSEVQHEALRNPQQTRTPNLQTTHAHPPVSRPRQPRQPPSPAGAQGRAPTIDNVFFDNSVRNVGGFAAHLEKSGYYSGSFEQARLRLLAKACGQRDCMYLMMHQVYCLYSLAPTEFLKLPGFTAHEARGLSVFERAMVANHLLSPEFLQWCAHFPGQITVLMQRPVFRAAMEEVLLCLRRLADQWKPYIDHVFLRGFPPFVAELTERFGITSITLAYITFLSTCRQLPGPSDESALKVVWDQDLSFYVQRCRSSTVASKAQIDQENSQVIRSYRSIAVPENTAPAGQQKACQSSLQSPNVPAPISTTRTRIPPLSAVTRPTGIPSPQPSQSPQMPVSQPGQPRSGVDSARTSASQTPSSSFAVLPTSGHGEGNPRPGRPAAATPRMSAGIPNQRPATSHVRGEPYSRVTGGQPAAISIPASSGNGGIPPPVTTPLQMVFPSQIVQSQLAGQTSSPTQLPTPISVPAQMRTATRHDMVQRPAMTRAPASQQLPTSPMPLLPPPGYVPPSTSRPNPNRDALHQAHLRSPINELHPPEEAGQQEATLFQYLSAFAVAPTPLGRDECAFSWDFSLSQADLDRAPLCRIPPVGHRLMRLYRDGTQVHRLRCIRVSPSTTEVSQHAWSITESTWPSVVYVFINGVEAFVRRRVHNGKDLPLDITQYLRLGTNTVSLHFIRNAAESEDLTYAMGVEVLDMASFSRVKELAQSLTSPESREQIRKRLSPDHQDDEVSIVSEDLIIDLVDPFTAKVFNRPVRGRFCGHQECFDHDTWILTRACKSGQHPLQENWSCPICGQDARPQSLIIDCFLEEVRAELECTNQLESTRAIQIKADGSWQVRAETKASDQSVPDRAASKRKLDGTSAYPSSVSQRPKIERSPSLNGHHDAGRAHRQSPEVISLD
ncbi:MIZ zinc finger domain protein [Aspergillus tanneri]|uniref:SP-RING-type domain-containing protein n=1 Tax=Aspergillus tanneri TaxID=1220188 RepID=A0A5M9MPV3_9EURO|nr:uncharacterized protein ATNIH1004_006022 [Aspergillus tanneri]KAA8647330.1 hypothetical protein ATNIH1004_006022 [Aspergillus tanneri]